MNTDIQSRLDTLDSSLTTLIDSLTSLNPSLPAAQALLDADSSLQQSVKQLSRHQANHNRISYLRSQITSLNTTITERLISLADLRAEIIAQDIKSLRKEGDERRVEGRELLEYAQRISRYTVPPNYRPRPKPVTEEKKGGEEASTAANGVAVETAGEKEGVEALPAAVDLGGWVPWPSEDVIRQGPLGQIQAMIEQGSEPTIDPNGAKLEDGAESKGEVMESVVKEEEEKQGVIREERAADRENAVRREVPKEEKPKVFGGLDLYDPDED